MRALYILRGAPGSGKSTWVTENGYEPLTVCPDEIRLKEAGIDFTAEGKPFVPQRKDKIVWQKTRNLIETRMKEGLTTILDSVMADLSDLSSFRSLADRYRYRVYVVDFTGVPFDVCVEQNNKRQGYKKVPEYILRRKFAKLKRGKPPKAIPVLMPEEAKQALDEPTIMSADEYDAINFIGDVHGCFTALIELLKEIGGTAENDYLNDNELYVFLGDYLDRGIENAEVLQFLLKIYLRKNVRFLEGNHEGGLSSWAECKEEDACPRGMDKHTFEQLKEAEISKKTVRMFIRKLGQIAFLSYREKKIFACHGGISCIPFPFGYLSTEDLIYGFGSYSDIREVEEAWASNTEGSNAILVHGHRSDGAESAHPCERVYCLEGGVEQGGSLRCVRFEGEAIAVKEIINRKYHLPEKPVDLDAIDDIKRVLEALRSNPCIIEKIFDDVSSFNFSSKAFFKGVWDSQTIRARGLFIDTKTPKIKARSYDKFFNLEERSETSLDVLSRKLQFPVDIFLKENGYLGICSSAGNGELFTASKSSVKSDHARRLAKRLDDQLGALRGEFSKYLESNDLSAVFEVIEPEDDPHIVEYEVPRLVLLALVRNDIHFAQLPFPEVRDVASHFGLEHKQLLGIAKNFKELCAWINNAEDEAWAINGEKVEGFVIEDRSGFMVKVKGQWYRKWKSVRGLLKDIVRNGRSSRADQFRRYYDEADEIYRAAKEYVAACPKVEKEHRGLCVPPKALNVIKFRNWYEDERRN